MIKTLKEERKILVVSFNWPPDTAIGAGRPTQLVSAFLKQGIQSIVLTVNPKAYGQSRSQDVAAMEGVTVIRTWYFPNPLHILSRLLKSFRWQKARMSRDSRSVSGTVKEQAGNSKMNKSMWTQLKRELLALFFTPDEFIGWGVVAVVPAIWAIKTYKPSTIISTGPPFTSQLIALIARTFCRVTWIADFRDPWAHSPTRPREITSKLSEQINEWLEKLVIHWADHVVFVSSATADWYKKRYPFACHSTWHVISNGFAEEEFRILRASEPRNRTFTISHIGSIEYQRSPLPVFQAIKELLSEGVFMREQVKVRLIGKCGKVNNLPLQDLINQYELEGVIEMVEPVPRGIALKEMCRAHVLLLLANDQRLQIPGKVYEYIGSGRPILAIAEHDSATADLMRQIGGVVTEVQEVACIKKALAQWYHESASLQRMRDQSQDAAAERLGTFEWAVLASQYKKIIA